MKINNSSGDEVDEKELNKRIGETIKSIRLTTPWSKDVNQKPMTQTKLSEKCNVTFQQIQKYEKGANGCSAYRLVLIANALKVSVDYIFDLALGNKYTFKDSRFVRIAELSLDDNNEIIIKNIPNIEKNELDKQT